MRDKPPSIRQTNAKVLCKATGTNSETGFVLWYTANFNFKKIPFN